MTNKTIPVFSPDGEILEYVTKETEAALSPQEQREQAYATWTAYQDGTPFYDGLTVEQLSQKMQHYVGDLSEYGFAKYNELSHIYTAQRQAIKDAYPDEVTAVFAAYTGNDSPVADIPAN